MAIKLGCCCPVIDNWHGEGIPDSNGVRQFWINGDCPLHGFDAKVNKSTSGDKDEQTRTS